MTPRKYREQAMYHQWRDFPGLTDDGAAPPLNMDCEPLTRRNGFFATLLNALDESRRLQAQHVIRQYRHLIVKERLIKTPDCDCECVPEDNSDMAITNDSCAQRPSTSLRAWMIALVVVFGILHLVGGIMLFGAASTRSMETALTAIRGD
jgi:hypothetical protein